MTRELRISLTFVATMVAAAGCTPTSEVPPPKEPEPVLTAEPPLPKEVNHPATIVIESSPPGLPAMVNGKEVGKTPVTVDNLPAGSYDVTWKDEANGDVTMSVDLAEGEYRTIRHNVVPRATD